MSEFDYEKMVKNVANAALDSYNYKGKSIREWIKIIAELDLPDNFDDLTNGGMIIALFPDADVNINNFMGIVNVSGFGVHSCDHHFYIEWWNQKYKKENKND